MEDFDLEFLQPFSMILETLDQYGWVMSSHMIGRDFQKVKELCENITQNPPNTDDQRDQYQKDINSVLTPIIFHPLTRSFFVFRAQELTHINQFSHHLDRAVIHYFKNDYFSAVHCLLPAIEGVLLSYFGWKYGESRKPTIKTLIEEIEKCRARTRKPKEHKLYSVGLARFLRNWIFSNTNTADMSLSYLNRHYILHGMGSRNYYSLADCQRLIVFFDLLIEFLAHEENKQYTFVPHTNEKINHREDYYFKLLSDDMRNRHMIKTEEELLKEHRSYYSQANPPNWNSFLEAALKEYMDLMKQFAKLRKGKS
jgi:hypothetical protein